MTCTRSGEIEPGTSWNVVSAAPSLPRPRLGSSSEMSDSLTSQPMQERANSSTALTDSILGLSQEHFPSTTCTTPKTDA